MSLHIGFTGTRFGMSALQILKVGELLDETNVCGIAVFADMVAHHGCCVGADEDFHAICRERQIAVVGHPGPDWPDGPLCAYTICGNTLAPLPHMKRNSAIVEVSRIMIGTPLQDEPQRRGGTWATIRMAMRSLRQGKLDGLYVVGRDGKLLDHGKWSER